ncbi:cytochrome c oxidase subunit II [bacterium]|nr:cytochrome c oxidase subunit II [bacterium]
MNTFLVVLVVILAAVAIGQVVRVLELSSSVSGKDPNAVTDADNNRQGWYMMIFLVGMLAFFLWNTYDAWGTLLPKSASVHGAEIDKLMAISMVTIVLVFFVTQPLLFYFSFKYRGNSQRKATYVEHDNKLELLWTSVPAVVLAGLILYGLSTWNTIMFKAPAEDPIVVEIYAKQFGWNARYAGNDNQLGDAGVRNIAGANILGVDQNDSKSMDDVVTTELHLPVGKPVLFKFRAQDVIHSAYMPHFRLQMNCVPGSVTQFGFTPTVTTAEMRQDPHLQAKVENINAIRNGRGDEPYTFDYVLLCNKICGSAHYNMQMKIVVETEEEYNNWMREQKTFAQTL